MFAVCIFLLINKHKHLKKVLISQKLSSSFYRTVKEYKDRYSINTRNLFNVFSSKSKDNLENLQLLSFILMNYCRSVATKKNPQVAS